MKALLAKIQAAKKEIAATKMKKAGYNEYSKYNYFTPEQVKQLVEDACFSNGIFCKFDLIRNELGITGQLTLIDLDTAKEISYFMASAIPQITATNATQQLGGAMTFTERYLKMTAFGIADNTMDFDAHNNTKPAVKLPDLKPSTKQWMDVVKALKNGYKMEDVRKKYTVSDEAEVNLKTEAEI